MKNRLHSALRSVVQWFGFARRAQPQERISPEQLRTALTEMLADPETARLLICSFVRTVSPIQGGNPGTAGRIAKFDGGSATVDSAIMESSGGTPSPERIRIDAAGNVGIGTTAPVRKLDVHETGINVVAARLAGLGTPPDYSRNVALSFHPRVDFLVNDSARIEAQLTSGVSGSEYADLALQTRAAGVLSTKMLIESGGNIGIGTTPGPGVRLDVAGGGVRSQGSAGGNHAFLGSFVNGTFTNWLNTGDNATFYNLLGGPDQHSGFGVAEGPNILSPIVWMYAAGGRNMFDVRSVGFQQNPTAGTSLFTVRESGNVGLGTSSPQSKLNVKGSASFTASGTVAVTGTPEIPTRIVTGTGTSFTAQVKIGDRITFTAGGKTLTRTVNAITNDTSLTVDADIHVTGSPLTMTVLPSIFRGDNASGTPTPQFTVTGDGHAVIGPNPSIPSQPLSGFLGLAGTRIHNDDDVGYVVCFFDNEGKPFLNPNNEMRGYNATMRYKRDNSADANKPPNGDGWDVIAHLGAVSLESMNLPPTDTEIRGQMKPFQSELRFAAAFRRMRS